MPDHSYNLKNDQNLFTFKFFKLKIDLKYVLIFKEVNVFYLIFVVASHPFSGSKNSKHYYNQKNKINPKNTYSTTISYQQFIIFLSYSYNFNTKYSLNLCRHK